MHCLNNVPIEIVSDWLFAQYHICQEPMENIRLYVDLINDGLSNLKKKLK